MRIASSFLLLLLLSCQKSEAPKKHVPPTGMAGAQKLQKLKQHSGVVQEVIHKDQFSYVKVGDTWFALVDAPVKVGQKIQIEEQAVFNDFESKTLNRKFKKIIFGVLKSSK
ncbi:MAG: hypothetical protein JKY15_00785 [Deltaproteobacteria bacterium]|nr:hypothetical protein [Deltaproteobacteria bacterium]